MDLLKKYGIEKLDEDLYLTQGKVIGFENAAFDETDPAAVADMAKRAENLYTDPLDPATYGGFNARILFGTEKPGSYIVTDEHFRSLSEKAKIRLREVFPEHASKF